MEYQNDILGVESVSGSNAELIAYIRQLSENGGKPKKGKKKKKKKKFKKQWEKEWKKKEKKRKKKSKKKKKKAKASEWQRQPFGSLKQALIANMPEIIAFGREYLKSTNQSKLSSSDCEYHFTTEKKDK